MATLKCKMCGGDLVIEQGNTVAECEYCGTMQTVPNADNEKKLTLFARANRLRAGNEFDKASGIYESIVADFPDEAEAYWGLVLCKYGIEYVDDPATAKKIPTCHRSSFESVMDDNNFELTVEYADIVARKIYQEEARQIEEIRKGIIEISSKEEPYDIFICYKETDSAGRRTQDSVLATELYNELTREGFKVFFSRITLEDKLGVAYEPYIFAALHSSKVMIVLGTLPEHFSAVWVKNEWRRFLALINNGEKKTLIPAYRDMDPYDLPEEFSHLQAQDMSRLGFMQDLVRGIKKIVGADAPKVTVKETVVAGGNTNTAPLLERAFMFLEDGDWHSADEYCEKVLDIDPKNAKAYLGKLMAEFHVKKPEDLKELDKPFESSNNYQKAIRFADEEFKGTLVVLAEANKAKSKTNHNKKTKKNLIIAMSVLCIVIACIGCAFIFYILNTDDEPNGVDVETSEATMSETDNESSENVDDTTSNDEKYNNAVALMEDGKYEEAITAFKALDGYKDSADKITECKYNNAVALLSAEKYEEALAVFETLDGYKDSTDKITECKYNNAVALLGAEKYEEALAVFETLGGYKDSDNKATSIKNKLKLLNLKIGDYITLGTYEQDGDKSNGKEAIEWVVLSVENGRVLVTSKYALDCEPYGYLDDSTTWETSRIRKWLNEDFLGSAFSNSETAMIQTATVPAHDNPQYGTHAGNSTYDKVFLLSVSEATDYFGVDSTRTCKATQYAISQGAFCNISGDCIWWLRTPGSDHYLAACVQYWGEIDTAGYATYEIGSTMITPEISGAHAVRPAMWIDLNALIEASARIR